MLPKRTLLIKRGYKALNELTQCKLNLIQLIGDFNEVISNLS